MNKRETKKFEKMVEKTLNGWFVERNVRTKALKGGLTSTVAAYLIAGARIGASFYDVSEIAMKNGVTSKPSLSRRKSFFNELGVIEDEKIPRQYGRPRIKLTLNEDEYRKIYE